MTQSNQPADQSARLAGLVSQVGCVTGFASILLIGIAFAAGRFLDNTFETGGIFTVLFLVGSFPITLYVIVRLSMMAVARAQKSDLASQPVDKDSKTTTEEETQL